MKSLVLGVVAEMVVALVSCKEKVAVDTSPQENKEAEAMLQGIWIDQDTEMATFKMRADSVYYPDSTALPSTFKVYGDTLVIGSSQRFPIVKQSPHLFWYRNQNGDVVKLSKSDSKEDSLLFERSQSHALPIITEVVKSDTVVMFGGEKYHCYVAINPTKYKVTFTTYNTDAVGVENVYYDNIIHLSVYKGATQLFSRDIRKQMYSKYVPSQILAQSILSGLDFAKADGQGLHFNATICMPDGAMCYLLDTTISFKGAMSMELIEY